MDKVLNLPFVNAWLKMLANFSDFKGRTGMGEFWWAIVGNIIVSIVVGLICKLFGAFGSVLSLLVTFVLLVPSIAMGIRRMHDIGKPGWWIIVPIANLVFACKEGDEDDNQYGSNPKYVG